MVVFFFSCINTTLSDMDVEQDLSITKKIIQQLHPKLELFPLQISPELRVENNKNVRIDSSDLQYYFLTRQYLSQLEDAHVSMSMSEEGHNRVGELLSFPIRVMIRSGRIYVDDHSSDIPLASEILSINGQSAKNIVLQLMDYTFIDGSKTLNRSGILDEEFSLLLHTSLGSPKEFNLTYKFNSKEVFNKTIKARPLKTVMTGIQDHHSFVLRNQICEGESCNSTININGISVFYSKINDFIFDFNGTYVEGFTADIIDSSTRDNAKDIIFDLRDNLGGIREFSMAIASPFIEGMFQHRMLSFSRVEKLPEQELLLDKTNALAEFDQSIKHYTPCKQGLCFKGDFLRELSRDAIYVERNIWILINSQTSSAAVEFAQALRDNNENVTLVGSEAAGSDSYHSGDFEVGYRLPNTGIEVYFSIIGTQRDEVLRAEVTGMQPDETCEMNAEALLEGRDLVLDCVLEEIIKNIDDF